VSSCVLQDEVSDGELAGSKAVEPSSAPASAAKCARGKTKKLTPEQIAARRRRLWVMIMKKEIPRVSALEINCACTVDINGHFKGGRVLWFL